MVVNNGTCIWVRRFYVLVTIAIPDQRPRPLVYLRNSSAAYVQFESCLSITYFSWMFGTSPDTGTQARYFLLYCDISIFFRAGGAVLAFALLACWLLPLSARKAEDMACFKASW